MILAVNLGNTNIRFALGKKKNDGTPEIIKQAVFYSNEGNVIELAEFGLGDVWNKISGSVLASVVPQQTAAVVDMLEKKLASPLKRIDIHNCGNLNTEQYKGLLGEDRVVCCARALQVTAPPLAVIDFGTATTINIVDSGYNFLGGAILPGLLTGLDALTRNTAQLPPIDKISADFPLIGRNTEENLISGAVVGLACAAEGFIGRIKDEMDFDKLNVIVTGGHAPVIMRQCRFDYLHQPDLLLEGLLAL